MTENEEDERLTRVEPATPIDAVISRYWHPVVVAIQLDENPVRRMRLLDENLRLYRSAAGETGLPGDVCPPRKANENTDRLARGEDLMGTIRDPARNAPIIFIRRSREHDKAFRFGDDSELQLWRGGTTGSVVAM